MKKRLLCPSLPRSDHFTILPEEEAHHAIRVLRLRDGEKVEALDGQGKKAMVTLRTRGGPIRLEYLPEPLENQAFENLKNHTPIPIILEMAVLKGSAMEWTIEKAVELGVTEFVPVLTAHTVVQIKGKGPESFQMRWQKIADQALKQCGRLSKMNIRLPISFESLLTEVRNRKSPESGRIRLWCDEKAASDEARPLLEWLQSSNSLNYSEIRILVGPEGGWSSSERSVLLTEPENTLRVDLGPLTLRAETAALFATSLVTSHLYLNKES